MTNPPNQPIIIPNHRQIMVSSHRPHPMVITPNPAIIRPTASRLDITPMPRRLTITPTPLLCCPACGDAFLQILLIHLSC